MWKFHHAICVIGGIHEIIHPVRLLVILVALILGGIRFDLSLY